MSRIFRRPMFRKGGGANMNGIMSGIEDRQNYANGDSALQADVKEFTDLAMQNAPKNVREYDPLTTFLLQYGPALASQTPTGSGLSGLISTGLSAAKKPVENLLEEQAARRKYLRDIKAGATSLALEKKMKQDLLEQEIKGRKEIAEGKLAPVEAGILETNIKQFPGLPEVAQRATNFQMTKSGALYNEVGPKAGGVISFDINDPAQVKQQKQELKRLDGKVIYDPYQDNYKLINYNKGKPLIKTFNSIEEINLSNAEINNGIEMSDFAKKTEEGILKAREKKAIEDERKRKQSITESVGRLKGLPDIGDI